MEGEGTDMAGSSNVWERRGLVLGRGETGHGSEVVGDPCIVWDAESDAWRMILFFSPPGHASSVSSDPFGEPGSWSEPEPLRFTNPEVFPARGTHKPFVILDAHVPNRAAYVGGRYWLLCVNNGPNGKEVQRGWAPSLSGPWTMEQSCILPLGGPGDIDELHVDVVSGYWFEEAQQFVYYYMANTLAPRALPGNPFGASVAVATQGVDEPSATKLGAMIDPPAVEGHWASGYLGGLQLLPGRSHRWIGVLNGSPTRPSHDGSLTAEEPAPCLGGFAYTDQEFPTSGWILASEPIEWIEDIPSSAADAGEGTNFWRQHILVIGDTARLFYNSGSYGEEQMYMKQASVHDIGLRGSDARVPGGGTGGEARASEEGR